jgi:hypothetical protein
MMLDEAPDEETKKKFLQVDSAQNDDGKDDSKFMRTLSGSLTHDSLAKQVEEKDRMLLEYKKNTENYRKCS